jgi:exodeoxyribonuclease V alpha subunit
MADEISGQVVRVVYANADTGYCVAVLETGPRREATIVGELPQLAPGELIRAAGRWELDARHGRQFRVASYEPLLPDGAEAIARYLGSGLIKGIGSSMAEAIVREFGAKTFDVIDRQPERLRKVPGIGRKKAAAIREAWNGVRQVRQLGMMLQKAGAPRGLAAKLLQALGENAYDVVRADPYRLVGTVRGVGFLTADRVAASAGIVGDDPRRLRAGLLQAVQEAVDDGNTVVTAAGAVATAARLLDAPPETIDPQVEPLIAEGRVKREALDGEMALALPALAAAEKRLARSLAAIARATSRFRAIREDKAIAWVEDRLQIELADEQRRAVVAAIARPLLVVTGGPGAGKTTIVQAICELAEQMERRVALCAPTGRAAKRLAEASGRPAKTVHRLLEINPGLQRFERDAENPLEADLIVCDEASMLDAQLAMRLADAVPLGAHFVLVGDADQLPSVGPGNVLADLIACPWVATQRLDKIFRQAAHSRIIVGAHRIREGRMPELVGGKDSDFFFIEENDPERLRDLVVDLVARRLPLAYDFDPWQDIMVLAPMHRGEVGVTRLNEALRERLNPRGVELMVGERLFRAGDKVMQTANNYDYEIYNGDLGRVLEAEPAARALTVDFDGRRIKLSGAELDDLAPAYAVSIHKSQGSEYPCVVVALHTQHYIMLARNLLYTAVTRGKRLAVLCGSRRALERAVANDAAQQRRTLLPQRLAEQAASTVNSER